MAQAFQLIFDSDTITQLRLRRSLNLSPQSVEVIAFLIARWGVILITNYRHTMSTQFFAAQIHIPIPNKFSSKMS